MSENRAHKRLRIASVKEAGFDEKWVQQIIFEDPSILGLGDLVARDKERPQPKGGRLDLLFVDPESTRRYETEVQLGPTDESHIIRCIEYWDIEKKRYPQYDHCAVIIAEEITGRFYNVISLFNGVLPIIALKLTLVDLGKEVGLLFTKVLDEYERGTEEEDEVLAEPATPAFWETKGSKESVAIVQKLFELIRKVEPKVELKFNKHYIGLAQNSQPFNFVTFRPRKKHVAFMPRHPQTVEFNQLLEDHELETGTYDRRWNRYVIGVTNNDINKHSDALLEIIRRAHEYAKNE